MKKNVSIIKRLLMLAMAIVMSVSCLTISSFATETTYPEEYERLVAEAWEADESEKPALIRQLWKLFGNDEILAKSLLRIFGEPEYIVNVRANGERIRFTDAQPYIDENNRTMMPLRAVAEVLGAEVTWDQATRTASVTKNGITVKVTIGSTQIAVVKDGKTTYKTMDTVAILNAEEGRTYVPFRYVAEGLGAYVDYSDVYRTVGIYSDVLTAEEIEMLRSFDYTLPRNALTYEEYKSRNTEEDTLYNYGPYRETFGNFANAHEYLYHNATSQNTHSFNDLGLTVKAETVCEFYELLVAEAAAEIGYSAEELVITFRADPSCVYQPNEMNNLSITVRGILTVTLNRDWIADLSPAASIPFYKLNLPCRPKNGVPTEFVVDIHLNTASAYNVHINNIVVLDKIQ